MAKTNGQAVNLRGDRSTMPALESERTGQQSYGGRSPGTGTDQIIPPGIPVVGSGPRNPGDVPGRYWAGGASPSSLGQTPGIPPAPEGTYDCYREIMKDPTTALAMSVVVAPIYASAWSVERRFQDVPQQIVDFVHDVFSPRESFLKLQCATRGLTFGARSFEQTYRLFTWRRNGRDMVGVDKFKPLRPERTAVLIERRSGDYAGLQNGKVKLFPEQTLHVPNDMEDDDWYGRSRLENVRQNAWWPWLYFADTAGRLGRKVSNIIPIVSGPLGMVDYDENEQPIRGVDAAQIILDAIVSGDGVMIESLLSTIEDLRGAPELAKVSPWTVKPYDTGSSSAGLGGLEAILRYYDSLKMRGMLRPERTAVEGQFGTKADAGEHADVGLIEGEMIHGNLLQYVNEHSVNRLIEWNFGPEFRDMVFLKGTPLADEQKALYRFLFEALLAAPGTLDLIASRLDLDAIATRLAVPLTEELNPALDDPEFAAVPIPEPDPNAPPGTDRGPAPPRVGRGTGTGQPGVNARSNGTGRRAA